MTPARRLPWRVGLEIVTGNARRWRRISGCRILAGRRGDRAGRSKRRWRSWKSRAKRNIASRIANRISSFARGDRLSAAWPAIETANLKEDELHHDAIKMALNAREVAAFEQQNHLSAITDTLKAQGTAAAAMGKGISPQAIKDGGAVLYDAAIQSAPAALPGG